MNLRESIDAQLNVLQRVYEGDTSPETIQEAVALNHQMHRLLTRAPAYGGIVFYEVGEPPTDPIRARLIADPKADNDLVSEDREGPKCVICGHTERPCECPADTGFNV